MAENIIVAEQKKTAWQELEKYKIKPNKTSAENNKPDGPETFDTNDDPYWS